MNCQLNVKYTKNNQTPYIVLNKNDESKIGDKKFVIKLLKTIFSSVILNTFNRTTLDESVIPFIKDIQFCYYKNVLPYCSPPALHGSNYAVLNKADLVRPTDISEGVNLARVCCVGCLEQVPNKNFQTICNGNRFDRNAYKRRIQAASMCYEGTSSTRLYLCGFISSRHRTILSTIEVCADDGISVNGCEIDKPSLMIHNFRLDPIEKLPSIISKVNLYNEKRSSRQNTIDISNSDDSRSSTSNSETEEEEEIDSELGSGIESLGEEDEEDEKYDRDTPNRMQQMYLYLFDANDQLDRDRDYPYLKKNNLQDIVMRRLEMLCNLCRSMNSFSIIIGTADCEDEDEKVEEGESDLEVLKYRSNMSTHSVYDWLLPLNGQESMIRDRIAIRFLCYVCSMSEEISKWYCDAEKTAISLNLRMFSKHNKDLSVLYTKMNKHMKPIKYSAINSYYTIEEYVVDEYTKHIEEGIKKSKNTESNNDVIVELAAKCIEYINTKVDLYHWSSNVITVEQLLEGSYEDI